MAPKILLAALGAIAALSPASAAHQDPVPPAPLAAPAGTAETRYCMRIEAITGSRLEEVKCWTRSEWAEKGVDVDRDWAEEGVRTIG